MLEVRATRAEGDEMKTNSEMIQEEISNLESVRAGATVNGIKMGDRGITPEWVESCLESLRRALTTADRDEA
jgi:hypothetical protein